MTSDSETVVFTATVTVSLAKAHIIHTAWPVHFLLEFFGYYRVVIMALQVVKVCVYFTTIPIYSSLFINLSLLESLMELFSDLYDSD